MESKDNHSLLMLILRQHFHNRPQVVDNAMQIIKEYTEREATDKTEYVQTLNTLYDMMVELPSNILLFFLTMVPLPKKEDCKSTVMELMKLTHNSLPENIRPVLLAYLNNLPPTSKPTGLESGKAETKEKAPEPAKKTEKESVFLKPAVKRTRNRGQKPVKLLVEICAKYVVTNQDRLKQFYTKKKDRVWGLLNKNVFAGSEEKLAKCYEHIKYLNKKIKLLRMIENENVTTEFLKEEYGDSEILWRQYNNYDMSYDPFEIAEEVKEAIAKRARK